MYQLWQGGLDPGGNDTEVEADDTIGVMESRPVDNYHCFSGEGILSRNCSQEVTLNSHPTDNRVLVMSRMFYEEKATENLDLARQGVCKIIYYVRL